MNPKAKKLRQRRDRYLEMAETPTEAIRTKLLNIARLCEVDVELIERSCRFIADSKELIAKADTVLTARHSTLRTADVRAFDYERALRGHER